MNGCGEGATEKAGSRFLGFKSSGDTWAILKAMGLEIMDLGYVADLHVTK